MKFNSMRLCKRENESETLCTGKQTRDPITKSGPEEKSLITGCTGQVTEL